jgi:hypothetical protein
VEKLANDASNSRLPPTFFQSEPPLAEASDGILEEAIDDAPPAEDFGDGADILEAAIAHSLQAGRADDPVPEERAMEDNGAPEDRTDSLEAAEIVPERSHSFYSFCVVVLLLIAAMAACGGLSLGGGTVQQVSAVRRRVEKIHVTTGTTVQNMLGAPGGGSPGCGGGAGSEGATGAATAPPPVLMAPPRDPDGVLLRLQGRVVAKAEGALTAPFSGRPCVLYSASVSHPRNDGVHQPPTAFHSASVDFVVQLLGGGSGPDLCVEVHSHDVSLFDMTTGRFAAEHTFADANDAWRGFVLAHLTMDKDGTSHSMSRLDVTAQGQLEFCECALVTGSLVTCVGEIARDRNGAFGLYPWRPKPVGMANSANGAVTESSVRPWLGKAMPWLATSWEGGGGCVEPWEPLAGHVLISDDDNLTSG